MNRREFSKSALLMGMGMGTRAATETLAAGSGPGGEFYEDPPKRLPVRKFDVIVAGAGTGGVVPGEVLVADDPVVLLEGRPLTTIDVVNDGDRPVQVGSHFHFAEANEALSFDRGAATGRRLAVPAGTSVRFEPGVPTTVVLVDLAGEQVAAGFRGLHGGAVAPGGAS